MTRQRISRLLRRRVPSHRQRLQPGVIFLQAAYRRNQLSAAALIAVAAAGSMVMLAAAAPSRAATNPTPAKVAVAQGISAAGLAVKPGFATPAATREAVSFVLKERDLPGLAARAHPRMPAGYFSPPPFPSPCVP